MIAGHYYYATLALALLTAGRALGQQLSQPQPQPEPGTEPLGDSFPYYMKSPIPAAAQVSDLEPQPQSQQFGPAPEARINQRATIPQMASPPGAGGPQIAAPPPPSQPLQAPQSSNSCLYDRHYFARFDKCLERRPYPTIGLAAFKNEDLLVRNGLHEKHGCSFVLTGGLFKHYQLAKYSVDSDTKCLDDNKVVQLSMQFSNVTLHYMWHLRCLNQADQLLSDATLGGKTIVQAHDGEPGAGGQRTSRGPSICVGSSQNFGFTSLQLTNIEAQVELAIDIYKNWRITNITLAMAPGASSSAGRHEPGGQEAAPGDHQTSMRDFTFETLDGDELNWRYLNLYENWTRNRLHTNFLEQFRRFIWFSLQNCLSESSEKLPVKLVELFGNQRYS